MNIMIKELAEQAQDWADAHAPYASEEHEYFVEKFAELIVRECIEVVKWTPSQFPNGECVKNIKEHFGVKE